MLWTFILSRLALLAMSAFIVTSHSIWRPRTALAGPLKLWFRSRLGMFSCRLNLSTVCSFVLRSCLREDCAMYRTIKQQRIWPPCTHNFSLQANANGPRQCLAKALSAMSCSVLLVPTTLGALDRELISIAAAALSAFTLVSHLDSKMLRVFRG